MQSVPFFSYIHAANLIKKTIFAKNRKWELYQKT